MIRKSLLALGVFALAITIIIVVIWFGKPDSEWARVMKDWYYANF